ASNPTFVDQNRCGRRRTHGPSGSCSPVIGGAAAHHFGDTSLVAAARADNGQYRLVVSVTWLPDSQPRWRRNPHSGLLRIFCIPQRGGRGRGNSLIEEETAGETKRTGQG